MISKQGKRLQREIELYSDLEILLPDVAMQAFYINSNI
jgi:hypothetical protein